MTRKFLIVLSLLSFVCFSNRASAQFYTLGNDPTVRWKQIKTEHYDVIYPRGMDSLARRYVSLLENVRGAVMEPLRINPKRIPVVLHPFTNNSNGVVTWAPKRVDLITTPPAYESTSEPWDKSLVVHESRHVGQVTHFERGVFKYLYWLIGEQSPGLGVGLYPSKLFLEGDAVITETELSSAGRGRNADFLMYSRAAFLNGDFRNWDRLRFGSYKYYTPNDYVLGYIINTAIRYGTGNYFYSSTFLRYLVDHFYNPRIIFMAFNSILSQKRIFCLEKGQEIMTKIWKDDLEMRGELTEGDTLVKKRERLYTNYRYPIAVKDTNSKYFGSVLALKSGMEHARMLVEIDSSGSERVLRPFNYISSPLAVSSDGFLYWTETVSHEMGQLEDFSELKSYDLKKGHWVRHRWTTRYFNPAVSHSGDTIAVAEYPPQGSSFLVLLDSKKEGVIKKVEAPEKGQIKESVFIGGDIYCSAILDKGLGIYKYSDGDWSEIVPQQNQTIVGMKGYKNGLYFTSDLDGVNNIYYYDLSTQKLTALTNSKYGASDPYIEPQSRILYYSEFDQMGYHLAKNPLDSLPRREKSFENPYRHPIAEMLSSQAKMSASASITDTVDGFDIEKYPSKNYNKLSHLFRIHSWAPVYYNISNIRSMSYDQFYDLAAVGATVYSQNTLGTAVTMLGYSYHKGFHAGHLKFTSTDLPVSFEVSADFNDRNRHRYDMVEKISGGVKVYGYSMNHSPYLRTSVLAYLPIILTSGGWIKGFIPQIGWSFSNDDYYSYQRGKYVFKNEIQYGFRYYQMLPIPASCVYPRWGLGLSLMGSGAPGTGENFGNLGYIYAYFYLPGITRVQGLKITGSFQKQFVINKNYFLGSFASLPRGYRDITPTENFAKVSLDYAIPIWLGDKSLGSIMYFKRLKLIPFGDYAYDRNTVDKSVHYYSYGADVLIDVIFFRLNIPLSIGVRYARTGVQEGSSNYFKFLFSLSL